MKIVKFAVFTDLHYDHIHDGKRRVDEFVQAINHHNLDFMIALGDICVPCEHTTHILEHLRQVGVPCYFTIGNHDSDAYARDAIVEFFGMPHQYYSFLVEHITCIVLDTCYIKKPGHVEPYHKRNYRKTSDLYPYLPPDELAWLEEELTDSQCEYCLVFSHHSLVNDFMQRGVANRKEVQSRLEAANAGGKRVLLCLNGHDHGDDVREIHGVYYYTVNAMSYIWHGRKATYNYSRSIHQQYPFLKDMILYQEGLHAIVTVSGDGQLVLEGMEGRYQNIAPHDIGLGNLWNGVCIEPRVSSLRI